MGDERPYDIGPQEHQHDKAEQQEVPVVVIQDPGEAGLAVVAAALHLLDGASRRVPEKRPKVGLAVVIAAAPEPQRDHRQERDQDADNWNLEQAETEPGGEERRNVGVELYNRAGENGPGGIDDEGAIANDRERRFDPPGPAW